MNLVTVADLIDQGAAELVTGPFGTQLAAHEYVDEGTPVINVRNVGFGDVRTVDLEYLDDETVERLARHRLKEGDIVFGRKGAVERHAFISSDENGWIQGSDCIRLRLDPNVMEPRFVSFAFRTEWHKRWMQNHCSSGATMASLNQDILRLLEIPSPPLIQQRQVSELLGAFDDLIENNRRRIKILEEMARLIYREWFVHFRFPGHENVELVDSDLGPIPEGWDAVPLSELVTTQYGYTEAAQDDPVGPRYLRGMDMNKTSFIDWSAVPYCPISDSDRERFKVDVGDVFVIRMADPGKVGICEREVDAVFASYLVRLRSIDSRLLPYYLFFTLGDDRYQGWVTGVSTGATRKSVSAKVMTEPPVVLPPQDVQAQFVDTVAPVRGLLTNLLEQNSVLTAARDLLLPRLISGEMDVSDLDLDLEPVA